MRKHLGVLSVAALVTAIARPARAGEPLKPFVVLILDTSGSMNAATGSGPPSCGGRDTRINHATCAINRIVNSFGDMTFALGRFRETTNGTFTTTCDGNLDVNGNPAGSFPIPNGGDQCETQGAYCGNCNTSNGLTRTCTTDTDCASNGGGLCRGGFCTLVIGCNSTADCTAAGVGGTCSNNQCINTCTTNADCISKGGGFCSGGQCSFGACTTQDHEFQLLTALVDGNNQAAGAVTDGSCATCGMPTAGTDPTGSNEVWGVSPFTFTPLAAVLNGAKTYWLGNALASDGATTIWPSNAPGFAPIANDPTKDAFLPKPGKPATCNANPATCDNSVGCTSATNCCCLSQCRPYITILLTDGAETCTSFTNTTNAAGSLLTTDVGGKRYRIETKPIGFGVTPGDTQIEGIAHAGGAVDVGGINEGFYASDETGLQLAISAILADAVKTESCNAVDDDCDQLIDEDFPGKGDACTNGKLGQCKRNGFLVCKADGSGLVCNAANGGTGTNEVCNNLDDDCDGKTDEGLTNCVCSASAEQCNNIDDDCDLKVDEGITRPCGTGVCVGTQSCSAGNFGTCLDGNGNPVKQPTAEICNGIDDNCDGIIDGFSEECSDIPGGNPGDPDHVPPPIPENICRPGTHLCPQNGNGTFQACQFEIKPCNGAVPCIDGPNCNGRDDDCDNKIDEDFVGQDCSNNCGQGITVCNPDGTISCTTVGVSTTDPTCDNVDDDCDGDIDEEFACDDATPKPGFPATCNPILAQCDPSPTCTSNNCCCRCECTDSLVCKGTQSCVNGNPDVCTGPPISQESCDCSDNNCNDQVDEGNLCAPGSTCNEFCQCAFECAAGEFPCPLGKFCKQETQNCSTNTATCDPSDACTQDPSRSDCCCRRLCIADPCFGITCPPVNGFKQVCQVNAEGNQGTCVNACDINNCAPLICIPDTGDCKPDDCTTFPERCQANQNCINGVCVTNLCQGVDCPSDQYCVSGTCVNSCADIECPAGQRCRLGVCEQDPCGKECPFGQACNDNSGECVDNGCDTVSCPQGQYCNPNNNGGTCENDPCVGTACPSPDEVCVGGTCFDPNDFLPDAGTEIVVTTGGGGGCNTSGNGGLLFVGFGVVFLLFRRKGGRQ